MKVIEIKNLKKTFKLSSKEKKSLNLKTDKKVAVNDLTLDVFQGEIYGLLGPNGAGKTTTLRILSTLIKADSGEVSVLGNDVEKNEFEVRKNIAFLTNELKLDGYFTPNYLYKFFSDLHGVDENTQKTRKDFFFKHFGIDSFSDVKYENLSTGMKQKVSIVISLVHDPDVIIFDEPTNGLDLMTAKVVTQFLLELKNIGKTIILSTHIFSLVEKICDRVGIIMDGKLVCSDTIDNVKKDKTLEDAFFDLYEKISEVKSDE
ncbi:MAG: ABC transporter ATP-binding protein [Anaerorhabdus sp.]